MKVFDYKTYNELLGTLEERRRRLNGPAEQKRRQALEELGTARSLFADDMPKDIGRILRVDSLCWNANTQSVKRTLLTSLLVIVIVGAIAVPMAWLGNYGKEHQMLLFWIVIGVVAVVTLFSVARLWKTPVGTDYFVGDLGCSIVNFKGRRQVLDSRWTYYYRDYNVFLLSEQWQGVGNPQVYSHTLFESGFFNLRFSHPDETHQSAGFDLGTHCRRYEGGVVPEPQFYFWSSVEAQWTDWLLSMLGDDLQKMERQTFYEFRQPDLKPHSQPRATRSYYATPRISLDASRLQVFDRVLSREEVSRIHREIGLGFYVLVINTVDGESLRVSLSHLGNRLLLLRLLEKWQGYPVGYEKVES
ncbi:MAG: hypothetical protein IJ544_04680 [Prevotella sp.]|nr:hypothetical protein [Prevotella sp.]